MLMEKQQCHLSERDNGATPSSKLTEETPSPFMTDAQRNG
jgi:acetyl/propionyl-CoA carboxylase alpha subunit